MAWRSTFSNGLDVGFFYGPGAHVIDESLALEVTDFGNETTIPVEQALTIGALAYEHSEPAEIILRCAYRAWMGLARLKEHAEGSPLRKGLRARTKRL